MLLSVLKPVDSLLEVFFETFFCILISILMTNLFYSQVEGVPGSRTIICFFLFVFCYFVCFSFNYPILITYLFINLLF